MLTSLEVHFGVTLSSFRVRPGAELVCPSSSPFQEYVLILEQRPLPPAYTLGLLIELQGKWDVMSPGAVHIQVSNPGIPAPPEFFFENELHPMSFDPTKVQHCTGHSVEDHIQVSNSGFLVPTGPHFGDRLPHVTIIPAQVGCTL
eukprot:m.372521 g.372521  ORF g.372521 m.372521 type:complete len:145 (-) comp16689_c0_seq2:5339-5773(-)